MSIAGQSAYARIAARTPPLEVENVGVVKVPVGGSVSAAFSGELAPKIVVAGALFGLLLEPRKVTCIVTFSEELFTASAANFEATLRKLLSAGVSATVDGAFFDSSSGSAIRPAGMLAGLASLTPSADTPPIEAMRADLSSLVAALTSPVDPCFAVSPSRAVKMAAALPSGFAYPVFPSSSIPENRIVCIDAGGLAAGHGTTPSFRLTNTPTVHMEDTSPLPIGTVGTPPVVAAPTRSLFQTDSLALLAKLVVAWARRAGSASYIDDPAW